MHSHGRALNGLLPRAVDDVEDYDVREGELVAGVVNGWNFGDGHFHDRQLLEAVQERCGFEPGELRVVDARVRSPPTCSASTTGSSTPRPAWSRRAGSTVADMVGRQPWLDERWDFPVEVTRASAGAPAQPAPA